MGWFILVVLYLIYVGVRASAEQQRQQAERQRRLREARARAAAEGQATAGGSGDGDSATSGPIAPPAPRRVPRPVQPGPVLGPRPRMETVPPPPRPVTPASRPVQPAQRQRPRPAATVAALTDYTEQTGTATAPGVPVEPQPGGAAMPPALAGLTPWQQAIVVSEVLSGPRAYRQWRPAGRQWR